MGGTSDKEVKFGMANLASLCRSCHTDIHAHPENSYRSGFLVHSWDSPEDVAIEMGSITITLLSDGTKEETGTYEF